MADESPLILIVDDEEAFHEIAKTVLEAGGYRTTEAFNGEEGVKKAKDLRPDLVLMDMKMPKMTGAEALEGLRNQEETKDTPVIFLTNFGDPRVEFASDKHFAEQVGAKDFLSKSKIAEELLSKVKNILRS